MSVVLTGQRSRLCARWQLVVRVVANGLGHLVAVVMATLLMTVVDASIWIDKLDKPGIAQVLAFKPRGLDAAV